MRRYTTSMQFEDWEFNPDRQHYVLNFYYTDENMVGITAHLRLPMQILMREFNKAPSLLNVIRFIRGAFHTSDGVYVPVPLAPAKDIYNHFKEQYQLIIGNDVL